MTAKTLLEEMGEKTIRLLMMKRLYKSNTLRTFVFAFFMLACSPDRKASQISIPSSEIESLIHYYDQDEIDSIVNSYQNFINKNYSLDSLADSVKFKIWKAFGYGLYRTANYQEALSSYKNAFLIAENEYGVNHREYGLVSNNLALLNKIQGNYSKSIFYYQKALQAHKGKQKGETYNNLGALYRTLEKYDSSTYCYQKALELLPESSHYYPNNNLGNIYLDRKNLNKAREYFKEAIRLGESYFAEEPKKRDLIASAYNRLANTYLLDGDYRQSLQLLEKAMAINHEDIPTRLQSYDFQIENLSALENKQQALQKAQEADKLLIQRQSSLLSEKDKLFFVSQTQAFAQWGFQLAKELNDLEKAFYFAERGKAAVLQELSAHQQSTDSKAFKKINLDQVQNRLKPEKAIIEYQFTEDSLYAFLISREEVELIALASAQASELAIQFRNSLTSLAKEFIDLAPEAYQVFFAPLEPYLKGKTKILIIPDQELSYIPFEALLKEKPQSREVWKAHYYSKLPFLIRDYAISYHGSVSLAWTEKETAQVYEQRFIGFAPSRFAKVKAGGFSALKESQKLMKAMPSIMRGAEVYTYQASVEKLKEIIQGNAAEILHLDTHGVVNDSEVDSSYIVFTDSALYVKDILALNTHPFNLLVLSACETGEGAFSEGEGIISLARAFMVAGSENVIHSLWLAWDHMAAELFTHFYKALAKSKDYDEALQAAKIALIEEPDIHPIGWSNFVLYGGL